MEELKAICICGSNEFSDLTSGGFRCTGCLYTYEDLKLDELIERVHEILGSTDDLDVTANCNDILERVGGW